MKQYFLTQCKRLGRYFPGTFLALLILLDGLAGMLSMTAQRQSQKAENIQFRIGVVGSMEDPLLQLGIEAIRTYDPSRLALALLPVEESQAKKELAAGSLDAYIIVPEGFAENALSGNILPLQFISTVGASGLNDLVQRELTDAISRILLSAQKGVYGMYDIAGEKGLYDLGGMDQMALEYVEYVVLRDQLYEVQSLGIGDSLGLESYLLCGFLVLFLLLGCLPMAPLLIRRDMALGQMLAARGRPAFLQTVCDFVGFALAQICAVLAVAAVALCVPQLANFGKLLLLAVPATVLAAAMSYWLYSLAADLIGGVLLQFFVSLGMCFVSGCLYPVFFFPTGVQRLADWLPAGVARQYLSAVLTGNAAWLPVLLLLAYSGGFFLLGSLRCCRRIRGVRR